MKIFFFFFVLLFSFNAFADVTICIGAGCPDDVPAGEMDSYEAVYDPDTGTTKIQHTDSTANTPGVWNPNTFSCTNGVTPVANSSGDIICPARASASVKISDSKISDSNPSKDDVACDPSKPIDLTNPDEGCASQKTAIETNKLLAESNSKLGSIANSNATNSGLLSDISNTLKANFDANTDQQLKEPETVAISSYLSSGSGNSSCPGAESFIVFGRSHQFSYQPICEAAWSIRGLVMAIGAFSALLIVVTAL